MRDLLDTNYMDRTLVKPSEARSRNMAAIRSRDTKPEMTVRRAVHGAGFRYSLQRRDLPGRPDLVLPKFGVVVFVHGCFWHGHGRCADGRLPRSNTSYWGPKIEGNKKRDQRNRRALQRRGWEVMVVRECTLSANLRYVLSVLKRKRAVARRRSRDQ